MTLHGGEFNTLSLLALLIVSGFIGFDIRLLLINIDIRFYQKIVQNFKKLSIYPETTPTKSGVFSSSTTPTSKNAFCLQFTTATVDGKSSQDGITTHSTLLSY